MYIYLYLYLYQEKINIYFRKQYYSIIFIFMYFVIPYKIRNLLETNIFIFLFYQSANICD